MTLQEQINEDIKTAMKAKDEIKLRVLRQLKNALTNNALTTGNVATKLDDKAVLGLVRKQVSMRQDSIEQFKKGNREDLAANEASEMEILKTYLPAELSEEMIDSFIRQAISFVNATSKRDMGKVIKRVIELTDGAVDNKTISQKVGEILV